MVEKLKSLAQAITRREKKVRFGVLVKTSGETITFKNPGEPTYAQRPDGLFWCIEHEQGKYEILASLREGYQEVTPVLDVSQVETLSMGNY